MAINIQNFDPTTEPGVDFYQYANGGWIRNNPLPPEFSRYGSFDVLAEQSLAMVRELVESAVLVSQDEDKNHLKVGNFYKTGMDSTIIESLGINPLIPELERIKAVKSKVEIQEIIANWHRKGFGLLFAYFGSPDREDSEIVMANIYQGGLGMTDVEYYIADDESSLKAREEYRKLIHRMFKLAGYNPEDCDDFVNIVMEFETRLAKASMTRLERRDPRLTFNRMTMESLQAYTPGFNWQKFFSITGSPEFNEINVAQPLFFQELNNMFNEVPTEHWKAYLSWHVINRSANYLSSNFVDSHFDFYGRFLSGRQENQPRWKRVLRYADAALGEAIGQMYVEKHFPPEAKDKMMELVQNLRIAMEERITELDWMSDTTKAEALEKLKRINVKIGYPDKWRDYTHLTLNDSSFYSNIINASEFNFNYHINKIGKPVDPYEWGMTPQTVNAYYSPSRNEIVFPAGILQPPFFYIGADDAVNYGAIGMVIGHEMTHGFDDKGRQYDKEGNLRDWWTQEDAKRFDDRARVLVDQYNQYEVLPGIHANGELTLGENIADLGGLCIAFTALQEAWEHNPPPAEISGFTPAQRFFLAYAHVWAQNITEAEINRRTREDVHSLGKLRVNGPLPNMQEFYDAFGITETDPMYLAPDSRAAIW